MKKGDFATVNIGHSSGMDPDLRERKALAEGRIEELLCELSSSDRSLDRFFHRLFLLLSETDTAKFYRAFHEEYANSFADPDTQDENTQLPENCDASLRLLFRECAGVRTFDRKAEDVSEHGGIFAYAGDLIYKELALEVYSYVCEVTEGNPNGAKTVSGDVILEKIASMHHAYDKDYIEYRCERIFGAAVSNLSGANIRTNGKALWADFREHPQRYYGSLPFDPLAHAHVMQKIKSCPEENRYAEVIEYLSTNACGQTVGFNGNVVKLPFFLKALSETEELPFWLAFYEVDYHPALFTQGYGGLYTKLSEAFIRQRRADAQFLQKHLPTESIRRQIRAIEEEKKQGLETLHLIRL